MRTTTEITTKSLIRRFHTLLGKHKISNDAKAGMLAAFGVESSTELDVAQLTELCDLIEKQVPRVKSRDEELDKLRKSLMAAIFGWRESMGAAGTDMNLVKGIACRAAEVPAGYALSIRFNSIPKEKLRSLYSAFSKMSKDMANVKELTVEMVEKLTTLN